MNNALIAIDLLTTALNSAVRINKVLAAAQAEGRDVTDAEIAELRNENNDLENELLSG